MLESFVLITAVLLFAEFMLFYSIKSFRSYRLNMQVAYINTRVDYILGRQYVERRVDSRYLRVPYARSRAAA